MLERQKSNIIAVLDVKKELGWFDKQFFIKPVKESYEEDYGDDGSDDHLMALRQTIADNFNNTITTKETKKLLVDIEKFWLKNGMKSLTWEKYAFEIVRIGSEKILYIYYTLFFEDGTNDSGNGFEIDLNKLQGPDQEIECVFTVRGSNNKTWSSTNLFTNDSDKKTEFFAVYNKTTGKITIDN